MTENRGSTQFTHRLVGQPSAAGSSPGLNYWVLVDRDNDPATGGTPAAFPPGVPEAAFTGVELITHVRLVPATGATETTVWLFIGGSFVPSGSEFIAAFTEVDFNYHDRPSAGSLFGYVTISFTNSVRGPLADVFRLQACTENEATATVDCLDDSGLGGGARYSVVPPTFPVCGVTPALVDPGDTATVEVFGMDPNVDLHVVLGDRLVAHGTTDDVGEAAIPFRVGVDSRTGTRLVTVGIDETALTADCFVEVSASLPFFLTPEIALNALGQDHTATATLRDEMGDPQPGVAIAFSVDSGPNAGASGICSFNADCTTDGNGVSSFTYIGDGGIGVDEISASHLDTTGALIASNSVLKFWDEDCNQNAIADTCDIDCGGLGGVCAEVLACGGSGDANDDAVPDECNRPPDCGNAGAEPDELWPPNHKFREITIAGVTDEDGDPVTVMITSITQDEPVDGMGQGKTSPDATGVGTSTASVRAERSGTQDGRTYHVGFAASDGRGGACTGEVTVCVPHDQRPGHFCGDQGPLFGQFDSTEMPDRKGGGKKRRE